MTAPNYNTLNQPNPNILPPHGDMQPPHEWPHTAQGINNALANLRESTRQYETTRLEVEAQYNHLPQNLRDEVLRASLKGRDFAAEREVDLDYIRDVAKTENTEQILNLLYAESVSSATERQQVDGGVIRASAAHNTATNAHTNNDVARENLRRQRIIEGPVPTMAAADKARLQVLEDERMHHKGGVIGQIPIVGEHLGSHLNYALNIPGWVKLNREEKNLALLQEQYAEHERVRQLQDTSVHYPHSQTANEELLARIAANRAGQNRANLGEFDTIAENLFDEIDGRRRQAVERFNKANAAANTVYDSWDLGQWPPRPDSRLDARDALDEIGQALQELSPRDPAYWAIHSRFVQQTYRLQERDILHHTNNPMHTLRPASEYTPNGGILVHVGTPEAAVFFSDGSLARPNGSAHPKDWTRYNSVGQEINPGPKERWPHITEQLGREPLPDVFKSWETCRSPETAARLHAELGFHTNRLEAQENHLLSTLEGISDQITDLDNLMRDQGKIATDPSQSAEDQKAARAAIADAATQKGDLQLQQAQTYRDIGTTHATLTPLLYQRQRLVVDNDGRAETPTMTVNGAVFQIMSLYTRDANGGRGGIVRQKWALLQDGRTASPVIDPSTGHATSYDIYDPDGTFRENVVNF